MLVDRSVLAFFLTSDEDCSLTENQRVQVETVRSASPRVSKLAIRRFLQELTYPVHFLDFETFSTAIPKFDGLRPFQRVPFQFSLHIQASPGADLVHRGFLANGAGDPCPDFMARLREVVAQEGSLVAYNAAFEKGVLRECADALPAFQPWVESLEQGSSICCSRSEPFDTTTRRSKVVPPERLCLTAGDLTQFVAGAGQTQWFSYSQLRNGEGWGGQRDSNPQQPEPQSGALPLSYGHHSISVCHRLGFHTPRVKHWPNRLRCGGRSRPGLLSGHYS